MGEIETPPDYYFIHRAAKELGMPYHELEQHPERSRLMSIAFTVELGKAEGEEALKQNPKFKEMIRSAKA